MKAVAIAALLAPVALSACQTGTRAPYDKGVCYAVESSAAGEPVFHKVADNQPQIEFCAARLEEMRMRFLRMGGTRHEIAGAYQGQFIFIDRAGVSFSKTFEGNRFTALARTGDGRLAIPGAIQRQIDGAPTGVIEAPAAAPAAPAR